MANQPTYSRPGSITMKSASMTQIGHINSPKYTPKVPDMNVNHGWKIHGDLVADLTKDEAYAKLGLERVFDASGTLTSTKIVDQKAYDAFNNRLSALGIDTKNTPSFLPDFADSFLISRKSEEIIGAPVTQAGARPQVGITQFKYSYSNPLDTLSMMEVFHENETQYKASGMYGQGRSFTGYTQTLENRDKVIADLEQKLGDRLQDVDQKILGGHQTEGATQLSQKITGRFTTEYTDIPSVGGAMDWSSQNPAALKGQDAIDNVMATNPEMRPYIHTGVIDDQSAANLQKLTNDFPVFNEMLHGPNGYVSPYGTIEDTFSQQGYDYKTGKAVTPSTVTTTPVNPSAPPPPQPAPPPPPQPVPPPPQPVAPTKGSSLKSEMHFPKSNDIYSKSIDTNHGYKLHFDPVNYDEKTIKTINDVLGEKFAFKHGEEYGPGKNYTLYAQSLENRDEAIKMIEEDSRISGLIKSNADIVNSESLLEGNIEFSSKTTGRFTTQYNQPASQQKIAGEIVPDFSKAGNKSRSAFEAGKKGLINRYDKINWLKGSGSPGSKLLGNIDFRMSTEEITEDIGHLQKNFPEMYELLMGKPRL